MGKKRKATEDTPTPEETEAIETPVSEAEGEPTEATSEDATTSQSETAPEAEQEDWKDRYLRALADLQNLQKRVHKEKDLIRRTTVREVVRSLLPCFDNLERALGSGEETDAKMLLMGVKMVHEEIHRVLGDHQVRSVLPKPGDALDPNEHEAVTRIPTNEQPEGTVVSMLERGYLIGEVMIRPARVIVAAPPPAEDGDGSPD